MPRHPAAHRSGRARAAVSLGRDQGRSAPLHWRPEPIPVVIVGLRRHVHYARADSRRAELLGAGESARRRRGPRTPDREQTVMRPLLDFSNWSGYVAEVPPVLLVRVTPRLVEGFWMKVARGAAQTQGVSMPPIKRPRRLLANARVLRRCRGHANPPVQARARVDDTDVIYEGLAVFDPGALGPPCGSVS